MSETVTALKGVGTALAQRLEKLGIVTVRDLLLHLPHRYQDRTRIVPLGRLQPGTEALVAGEVLDSRESFGRRRSWLVRMGDRSGFLTLRFFHFNARQQRMIRPGRLLRCFGEARLGPDGLEMVHPEYSLVQDAAEAESPSLTPVYPSTEGLSQTRLRALTEQALALADERDWPDLRALLDTPRFPSSLAALELLHRPPPDTQAQTLQAARERLALEELAVHIIAARVERALRKAETTEALPRAHQLGRVLLDRLGFELTKAQRRVTREVLLDMEQPAPMLRLLQGDVGSGKTVVAAFAAIRAAEHGRQTAIMAPTEILAEQHYLTFSEWLEPLGISVCLLTGKLPAREKRSRAERVASGEALVVIGTHALFQGGQDFARLALIIIDEQHRFGVHQRLALRRKGRTPHQLVMTATPIPRTLTMTMYADMDVSVLDELPRGRQPVRTVLASDRRRDEVIERVGRACRGGGQAYWVCTLIEESEALQASAAETTAQALRQRLAGVKVGLVHGRMPASEKARIMDAFKRREIELLVATTVIEVGIDVPEATLMVIENAERLGLAQLHQLRGRVGRGAERSYCILLYKEPLAADGMARLKTMRASQDGFVIAEEDLKLRGPGDLLGTRQTGERELRVARLTEHAHLLPQAQELARRAHEREPLYRELLRAWAPGGGRYFQV